MPNQTTAFSELGISASILDVLKKLNLDAPTPIQHQAIPIALKGQDLIGIAQTGTGKTFAFGIPILQRLAAAKGQGLVIVPTRELALQVTESLKKLGQAFGLRLATLIGGESLDRQLFALRRKPHIIVATPGRLIDHLNRKTLKLDPVKILVLDEADMMLDMGFAPQVEEILKQVPQDRQTMLFSATMPASIAKLAARHLKLPISIEVTPQGTTVDKVEQEVFIVSPSERFSYLEKIVREHQGSILVFVRTKHGVKEINKKLVALGQRATEIHSNLSLNRRRAALDSFKSGKSRILVATDVAARGLDVSGIELVVNYNLPDASADYVHRIGRTGRAGQIGKAISLATPDQLRDIREIERLINKSLAIREYSKLERDLNRPRISSPGHISARPSSGRRHSDRPTKTMNKHFSQKPARPDRSSSNHSFSRSKPKQSDRRQRPDSRDQRSQPGSRHRFFKGKRTRNS
ncbi:MAG: DEAD/DEAH box helicase [Patescibacteria group bacterium]